jgi:hypothetical protein
LARQTSRIANRGPGSASGRHFAPHEEPDLLADDIRRFIAQL